MNDYGEGDTTQYDPPSSTGDSVCFQGNIYEYKNNELVLHLLGTADPQL